MYATYHSIRQDGMYRKDTGHILLTLGFRSSQNRDTHSISVAAYMWQCARRSSAFIDSRAATAS